MTYLYRNAEESDGSKDRRVEEKVGRKPDASFEAKQGERNQKVFFVEIKAKIRQMS